MKKFVVGAVAAIMMTAGLVATSGAIASANPYPGTVPTKIEKPTKKQRTVKATKKAKVRIRLTTQGNAVAAGTVKCVAKPNKKAKNNGGKKVAKTVNTSKKRLNLGKLKKGKYAVTCKYQPAANSVYQSSKFKAKIKVR